MPRTKRMLIEGVCYHIINRGNQKQRVFLKEGDYKKYLEIVKHYKKKFYFKIYAYCLMPNHVHLIIESRDTKDLAKIMQGVTQVYSVWFNNKYNKIGRLWQGRYKSKIIEKDKYLIDCLKYIELNPIRAKIVASPSEYLWNSWQERKLSDNGFYLLDVPEIL
ncbi:MAG: transposase [Candidatus Omnitrophica bacterium]|nr:transposase [Candidatus Omnitrophota bacterium]